MQMQLRKVLGWLIIMEQFQVLTCECQCSYPSLPCGLYVSTRVIEHMITQGWWGKMGMQCGIIHSNRGFNIWKERTFPLTWVVCCGDAPEQVQNGVLFKLFTSDGSFKVLQQLCLYRNTLTQFTREWRVLNSFPLCFWKYLGTGKIKRSMHCFKKLCFGKILSLISWVYLKNLRKIMMQQFWQTTSTYFLASPMICESLHQR